MDRQGSNCFLFQVNLKSYHTRYQTKQRNQLVGLILVVTCSIFVLLGKRNLLKGICIAANLSLTAGLITSTCFEITDDLRNLTGSKQGDFFSDHVIFLVFSSRSHHYFSKSNHFCAKLPKWHYFCFACKISAKARGWGGGGTSSSAANGEVPLDAWGRIFTSVGSDYNGVAFSIQLLE